MSTWNQGPLNIERLTGSISAFMQEEDFFLTDSQAQLCAQHVLLMQSWNRSVNLTRITDLREILIKHLLDSLIPSLWLPHLGKALDIGTGAGFPGVPIKIAHPELCMTLLESKRKKVSFLKVLLTRLQMRDIRAIQGRWEDLIETETVATPVNFDLIILRALRLNPYQLAGLAGSILNLGGTIAWWTGPNLDKSTISNYNSQLKKVGIRLEGCFPYNLPSISKTRNICVWKKLN